MQSPPVKDGPPMNHDIRAPRVLLIDQNGEKQGVMPTSAALEAAEVKANSVEERLVRKINNARLQITELEFAVEGLRAQLRQQVSPSRKMGRIIGEFLA
jgi:hypothetical protein